MARGKPIPSTTPAPAQASTPPPLDRAIFYLAAYKPGARLAFAQCETDSQDRADLWRVVHEAQGNLVLGDREELPMDWGDTARLQD